MESGVLCKGRQVVILVSMQSNQYSLITVKQTSIVIDKVMIDERGTTAGYSSGSINFRNKSARVHNVQKTRQCHDVTRDLTNLCSYRPKCSKANDDWRSVHNPNKDPLNKKCFNKETFNVYITHSHIMFCLL